MKNVRGFGLGLALGLGFAFSSVGFAQNTTQFTQTNKTESGSAMASCCKGDSCAMKDHVKKEETKSDSAMSGSCCGADSCNLKTHDSTKQNHSEKDGGCCCTGDSCAMNHEMKEHARNDPAQKDHVGMDAAMHAAMHGGKGECCCSGDSCDMKMKHDTQEKARS
jgi:hypothetical protein